MVREKVILIILLILFFNFILGELNYCQDSAHNNYPRISREVSNFFNEVEIFFKTHYSSGCVKNPTREEIKKITWDYYNTVLHDPLGYETYTRGKYINNERPGVILHQLRLKISEFFTYPYADLLTVPYLLRVKIIDTIKTLYNLREPRTREKKVSMISVIEDIIKGENHFKISDTISINYLSSWYLCKSDAKKKFEVGNSYLIPMTVWYEPNEKEYRLQYLGESCPIYLINNDTIYTPADYFDIGEITPWKKFRDLMIEYYTKIPPNTFSTFIRKRNLKRSEELNCEELQKYSDISENITLWEYIEEVPQLIVSLDTLYKKIRYPDEAFKNNIEGKIMVQFFVDISGRPRCPEILKGWLGFGCEEEAIRFVSQLKFIPGRVPAGGKPAVFKMVIPIIFKMNKMKK